MPDIYAIVESHAAWFVLGAILGFGGGALYGVLLMASIRMGAEADSVDTIDLGDHAGPVGFDGAWPQVAHDFTKGARRVD